MKNIVAEFTTFRPDVRQHFEDSFGAKFVDKPISGVTMTASIIDDVWVNILFYAILGVVGVNALTKFDATDVK